MWEAVIAAVVAITSAIVSATSTKNANEDTIEAQKAAYEKQLADQKEQWTLTNTYNSPQAQMERFQAAGLNPNLIYGQQNTAQGYRVPDFQNVNIRPQTWHQEIAGGLDKINQIYDFEQKAAQTDNLKAQNDLLLKEAEIKDLDIKQREFDLGFKGDLRDTNIEFKKESLRQLRQSMDLAQNRDLRESIQTSRNVIESSYRVQDYIEQWKSRELERSRTEADRNRIIMETRRVKENINLLRQQGVLNQFDIELRKNNINPSDPLYARLAQKFLDTMATDPDIQGSIRRLKSGARSFWDEVIWSFSHPGQARKY